VRTFQAVIVKNSGELVIEDETVEFEEENVEEALTTVLNLLNSAGGVIVTANGFQRVIPIGAISEFFFRPVA
jgi:hypothetical protein